MPGLSRAIAAMYRPRGCRWASVKAKGSQRSAGLPASDPLLKKIRVSGGMTPITVAGSPLPQLVAEDGKPIPTARSFVRRERSAKKWRNAERRKEVRRHRLNDEL